jgi:hypothetical protein
MIMGRVVFFFGGRTCRWLYNRYGTLVLEAYKTQSPLLLRVESPPLPLRTIVKTYRAMFDALIAASLALLIIDSAHAQVYAPNCTNLSYAWVGYPWLVAEF